MKENVIVGRLIPAGTGATKLRWNKVAEERDIETLAKNKRESSDISATPTDIKGSNL